MRDSNPSPPLNSGARLLAAVAMTAAVLTSLSPTRAVEAEVAGIPRVDLVGSWYVLVHYTDDHSPHPDRKRWEDKLWVFEKSGSRLMWREYPIVVFDDDSGRFERRASGQYARVLSAWEPSEAQQADIRSGLQVNDRGSKKKTLRGSDSEGWRTANRARQGSASVISYVEDWSIDGLPTQPVFERRDMMGSGRTDSLEGATRYATVRVQPSGNRLSGTYDRDGVRHGTFRMMRTGGVEELKEAAKTQAERNRKVFEQMNPTDPAGEDGGVEAR